MKICFLFFAAVLLLPACYYDKEEALYGTIPCDTLNVKFSVQITQIVKANCLRCHAGNAPEGGNIPLGSYNDIVRQATGGKLMGAVTHAAGYEPMPKGAAKLSKCDIAAIRTWIRNGTPNN